MTTVKGGDERTIDSREGASKFIIWDQCTQEKQKYFEKFNKLWKSLFDPSSNESWLAANDGRRGGGDDDNNGNDDSKAIVMMQGNCKVC